MIKLLNITKVFSGDLTSKNTIALSDVSFNIESGKITGFLGANGAGKTTLIKIIMDFIRANSGEVQYCEGLGSSLYKALKQIGYLPERPYFYPQLNGYDFLQYMGKLSQVEELQLKNNINQWSKRLGIDFALNRKLHTYSKGMLQRLGLCSVLLNNPRMIILDEPLSGLDPVGRKEIKDIIKEIHCAGISVFFSTHIVSDVEEIGDNVVFLKQGKLVYSGSLLDILSRYKKRSFRIKYLLQNKLIDLNVAEEDLENQLSGLLSQRVQIISVQQEQMKLEEIFYNIKG